MLGSGELAQLRADVAYTLPDRCTVQRPGTPVSDGAGGWTTPYADVAGLVGIACAVAPFGRGAEQVFGGRVVEASDWVITLPAATDVRQADRVVATVTDQADTRTFEVVGIAGPRSLELSRRVACREVNA